MRSITASLGITFAAGLVLAGCAATSSDTDTADGAGDGTTLAVGTTTMLGSVVADIMECAGGTSQTLMPIGADPHEFSPSSRQVAALVSARLVVANGLGLEEGMEDALSSATADGATVLEVAPMIDPIGFGGEEDSQEQGSMDPHFWHDTARMAQAAEMMGAKLAEVTGDDAYATCGTEVHDSLMKTDRQVRNILSTVPADKRVLVTDHEAFGYFAQAYDFEVVGVVVPGGSTLAEPSSEELGALVDVIKDQDVPAIFSNAAIPEGAVDSVAAEAGSEVEVVELFVGSLGPEGSGAETYAGMVTTNAQRIADALS